MPISLNTTLPNPDCTGPTYLPIWDDFIAKHCINTVRDQVVRRYQNLEPSEVEFMDSNWLSHYLNRELHGPESEYAALASDEFGSDEPDATYQATLVSLNAVFAKNSYRFSSDSKVFKGVGCKPYYQIHRFLEVKPGDRVVMPGFFSTSVCRDKALEFAGRSGGVLLVVRGLDAVDAIVPENSCVPMTSRPNIPEQEIILNRGITFEVESVTAACGSIPHQVGLLVLPDRLQL